MYIFMINMIPMLISLMNGQYVYTGIASMLKISHKPWNEVLCSYAASVHTIHRTNVYILYALTLQTQLPTLKLIDKIQ